jgi:hypothetical protein
MDVFNSLTNINERIDKIIYDRHFTSRLILFKGSLNDDIYPLYDRELDRLCYQLLPKIHDNIKWLSLEVLSMERILHVATYPNLYGLSLYNINITTHARLFCSKKFDLVFI